MNINDVFPSKYLKASDLQGRDHSVIIERCEREKVGREDEMLPILYFKDKQKGLILNKTNAKVIGGIHGPETDGWPGKAITLYSTEVDFAGQTTLGTRVRLTAPVITNGNGGKALADEPLVTSTHPPVDEDDIPF